jgi:putative PIN family toxin of toxin-antitoxin system
VRIVIDTNVLISALLNGGRVPDLVIDTIVRQRHVVLYDQRGLCEYRAVMARPKFSFSQERTEGMLASLMRVGSDLGEVAAWPGAMIDETDRMFLEVALAGRGDVLLTGNGKHYPRGLGFEVMGPTELLGVLEGTPRVGG